jgi:S-adenosylmethionine hydrolase
MPVVALLTDFGIRDHYVAAMKGVILEIAPGATLVDITHDIPPQDIRAASHELVACYRYFPRGAVFLAVVDPGVGSARRAIAAEAAGYRFVAPDNGVLTEVFEEQPPARVVELTDARYARPTVSRTFEGRDRFAPAAAWLAAGLDLAALGPLLPRYETLPLAAPQVGERRVAGEVRRVDRFGNLVTNIDRATLERLAPFPGRPGAWEVAAGGHAVRAAVSTYAETAPGEVCALIGSSDHLEIAVNGGSAAERFGLGRGAAVTATVAVRGSR